MKLFKEVAHRKGIRAKSWMVGAFACFKRKKDAEAFMESSRRTFNTAKTIHINWDASSQ